MHHEVPVKNQKLKKLHIYDVNWQACFGGHLGKLDSHLILKDLATTSAVLEVWFVQTAQPVHCMKLIHPQGNPQKCPPKLLTNFQPTQSHFQWLSPKVLYGHQNKNHTFQCIHWKILLWKSRYRKCCSCINNMLTSLVLCGFNTSLLTFMQFRVVVFN